MTLYLINKSYQNLILKNMIVKYNHILMVSQTTQPKH